MLPRISLMIFFQFQVLFAAQVRQLDTCTDHFGKWDLIECLFQEKGLGLHPDLFGNVCTLEPVLEAGIWGWGGKRAAHLCAQPPWRTWSQVLQASSLGKGPAMTLTWCWVNARASLDCVWFACLHPRSPWKGSEGFRIARCLLWIIPSMLPAASLSRAKYLPDMQFSFDFSQNVDDYLCKYCCRNRACLFLEFLM